MYISVIVIHDDNILLCYQGNKTVVVFSHTSFGDLKAYENYTEILRVHTHGEIGPYGPISC